MYVINQKPKRKISALPVAIMLLTIAVTLLVTFWYVFLRDNTSSSASFIKSDTTTQAQPENTKVITTEYFNITMPNTWENNGKKNPLATQIFYEFQDKKPKYDARYLYVFVDTFPANYPVNKVLAITNDGSKINSEQISSDCASFNGAPKYNPKNEQTATWSTVWEGISFTCDISRPLNQIGAASKASSYGQKVTGPSGQTHTYFFVYKDHNSRPNEKIFTDSIETFRAL